MVFPPSVLKLLLSVIALSYHHSTPSKVETAAVETAATVAKSPCGDFNISFKETVRSPRRWTSQM